MVCWEFYLNSLLYSVSPPPPPSSHPAFVLHFSLFNVAMHFTIPVSPPVSSQAFFKLPLLSLCTPTSSPSHSSRSHSLSLSLAHSLYLSHSLTEADVGQCVWSLSGTGERAWELHVWSSSTPAATTRAEDTTPWATWGQSRHAWPDLPGGGSAAGGGEGVWGVVGSLRATESVCC